MNFAFLCGSWDVCYKDYVLQVHVTTYYIYPRNLL